MFVLHGSYLSGTAHVCLFVVEQAYTKRKAGRGKWIGRRRRDSNPRGLFTLHDFQSCSLDHYETPPGLAERAGFEPARACTLPLFESGTFDHSDTSPRSSITYLL